MNTRPSPTPSASARQKNSASPITTSQSNSSSTQPPGMAPGLRSARGSTPGGTRALGTTGDGNQPTRPSSKDSLKLKIAKKADDPPKPSKSEEQLRALKSDFDNLRNLVTCKICDRLLYEPYIISCGHTYCYSCLCTWFVNNRARKTCPDCRAAVKEAPAPAYVIREMTQIFIKRTELLPAGETTQQHDQWQKEEADIVQQDKNNADPRNGGLFKGCFNTRPRTLRALRDEEDGVQRCPICMWELEHGQCGQCGLTFDEDGNVTMPGEGFGGFSDFDETSEHDMSGEDYDAEMDMDDPDAYGYEDGIRDWMEDEASFMIRRFFEHGVPPGAARHRRPMTHSEAGSRRPYSQSIVSDMYTDEMDTVEEEDEEGVDEDSSMNDFIDDGEGDSAISTTASSTPGQTPQPPSSSQRRPRRVVESEASSTSSHRTEEDEDDEGPIAPGRRRLTQAGMLNRTNTTRRAPSSTSTEPSTITELDEDTEALLQGQEAYFPLGDEGDEMEEDDDSDGGRTTVGWDTNTISNDRLRIGGSLTPTADRPRPNPPIRPPSRGTNNRFLDGSRGLRRRSSVLSTSTVNYEDGEADDDDSDMDGDGDFNMAMQHLRARQSQVRLRNPARPNPPNVALGNHGLTQNDSADADTDDNSDASQQGNARGGSSRARQQEYDPRISWMFASHLADLRESERAGATFDLLEQLRSTTPIARPRTANRNRLSAQASPAQPYSPFAPPGNVPSRLRTPVMENSLNQAPMTRGMTSPATRASLVPNNVSVPPSEAFGRFNGPTAPGPVGTASISQGSATSNRQPPQTSANAISQLQAAAAMDLIDRPPSRVTARPPSAAGRRNSPGFSPGYSGFAPPAVGLNLGARTFQAQGNPWASFVHPQGGVRTRASRQGLREQSSTATLRPINSRAQLRGQPSQINMRDGINSPQMRHQSSRRRLNTQASTRTLRAGEHGRAPPSPATATGLSDPAPRPAAPSQMTEDERLSAARELVSNRARELVSNRARALGYYEPGTQQQRTNPFTARRPSITNRETTPTSSETGSLTSGGVSAPAHIRTPSNESTGSIVQGNASAASMPPSPGLNRRRSNRNMGLPPGVFASPTQTTFPTNTSAYVPNYMRSRTGSIPGNSAYESPLNATARGMSPMVAAGNNGRY